MSSDNSNQATISHSPTLVPYANPAEVDREFLDLHGIPYPDDTPTELEDSEP